MLLFLFLRIHLEAENLRVLIAGSADIYPDQIEGTAVSLKYVDCALLNLKGDLRFYRGIQLDLSAPAAFLAYRGYLALAVYNNLVPIPGQTIPPAGVADLSANQLDFEVLPNKILNTWQIPLRAAHGLRNSPYVTILTDTVDMQTFPILFRLMPVIKGISEEMENMVFTLNIRPILSDEGVIKLNFKYPEQMQGKPVTVFLDDVLIENPGDEQLLKEGEHHLVILSEDYRNQSRRFMVERAKILDLLVELEDPTPLLVFEYPEAVRIFIDNQPVNNPHLPYPVDPGPHEVRFQMSNYSITRPITVQKGKTYKIALSVDVNISEND